jgi:hypothetical protein
VRPRRARLRIVLALTAASALVIPVALSWACGPQAGIYPNKAVYAPGESGTITGQNFEPGASFTISIEGGPTLASGTVPAGQVTFAAVSFTAPTTVGTYTLRVDGLQPNGNALPSSPQTIRVSAPQPAVSAPSGAADEPAGAAQAAPVETAAGAPAATAGAPTATATRPASRPSTAAAPSNRSRRPAAPTRRPAARAPAAAQPAQGQTPAVFAGSVPKTIPAAATPAPTAKATTGRQRPATSAGRAPAARPSETTAQASAWSGLGTGADAGLLPTGSFPGTAGSGANSTRTVSIVMLALGLAALAGGLGAGEARRRRRAG